MDDYTKLQLDYHHTFVYANDGVKLEFNSKGQISNLNEDHFTANYPGFWFSLDKDDKMVRCGCHHNILEKIQNFTKLPTEIVVYANQSVFNHKYAMTSMKEYKQKFKKLKQINNCEK